MRLIDSDTLKKLMEEECAEECAICCYANSGDGCRCKLIDNAPTVEYPITSQSCPSCGNSMWRYENGKMVCAVCGDSMWRYEERPQGDLISRTELKKCAIPCQIHNGALTDLCVPLYQIDNAPTIKDRSLEIAQKSIELGRKVGQYYEEVDKKEIQKSVHLLDLFTKTFCRYPNDYERFDDLKFRCDKCPFQKENGECLCKAFKEQYAPDYKDFGSMGDL